MTNHLDNLSVLFKISEVVAENAVVEEAIFLIMEEMSKKSGINQAILTVC